MSTQLFWFRNDLRIEDNTALIQAINQGPTVAIYVATPEQWTAHDDAPIKIDFWRRNLQELKKSLQKLNVPLYFFQVPSYAEIPQLFQNILSSWEIQSLHCNAEYPYNERKRDEGIAALCKKDIIEYHCYEDQCLLPPDFVLTAEGSPFKVFTPYAKKSRFIIESAGLTKSSKLNLQASNNIYLKALPELDSQLELEQINWPKTELWWEQHWPAGEKEASKRLSDFLDSSINNYKNNRDYPAINGTSSLSPYLSSGVISVRVCWENAKLEEGDSSTWCNELLWRDFYRYVMYHYPHVCMHQAWNRNYANIPWRENSDDFQRWCDGETGFPIIDAAMKQLKQTGWMHNRLRMVVAMFLSKNLLLDWRWGERWFMQNLIDGDFASNNGGWQWSASTGTDAAPYFRIFNPIRQSERFDAKGEFIKAYIPQLLHENEKTVHDPAKINAEYLPPIIDLKYSRERVLSTFKEYKGSI
ncbi:DNA photolyase family protein [Gammaproteobacteria bacterium]|nr:DNA photolyase family protein [Gammaproteobacteria bacterium]